MHCWAQKKVSKSTQAKMKSKLKLMGKHNGEQKWGHLSISENKMPGPLAPAVYITLTTERASSLNAINKRVELKKKICLMEK